MDSNLFDRCGGFAIVRQIVAAFYDKVLESPKLAGHFGGVDMRRLIDHQTKFMAMLMGGPTSFSDDALRRAHASLGITMEEFLEAGELLRESLEEFGLHPADVRHVHEAFMDYAPVIVGEAEAESGQTIGDCVRCT